MHYQFWNIDLKPRVPDQNSGGFAVDIDTDDLRFCVDINCCREYKIRKDPKPVAPNKIRPV